MQLSRINSTTITTLTDDDLKDLPLLGPSGEAEDRKMPISKAAAPRGAQTQADCDRGGWRVDCCYLLEERSQALL